MQTQYYGRLLTCQRFRLNVNGPVLTYWGRGRCTMEDGTELYLDESREVILEPAPIQLAGIGGIPWPHRS